MTKILKRVAAMGAAVMMMGTMVISASAKTESYVTYGTTVYCSSYQSSANTWIMTTSINKANGTVAVSGTGVYYTGTNMKTASINKGNGGNAGVSCNLRNNSGYGWKECRSEHSYGKSTHGMYTTGTFVLN